MFTVHRLKDSFPQRLIFRVLGLNRSTYTAQKRMQKNMEREKDNFISEIIKIALKHASYGYRRVAQEFLRKEKAVKASDRKAPYKRVYLLMKKNGLLRKRKRIWMKTTDSNHSRPIFPNIAGSIEVVRVNQLWVGDITYCAIDGKKFVYFAFIMDAYSRKVIGWDVSMNIDAQLCLNALNMALSARQGVPLDGLIHHTDQGVQYASNEYTKVLAENNIVGSMSRKGNPYDNAIAESFFKTFKHESLYRSEQNSFSDVYNLVRNFIKDYNTERLHSSIGYMPPAEFELDEQNNFKILGGKSLLWENQICYREVKY